jgi:hypothetical protein
MDKIIRKLISKKKLTSLVLSMFLVLPALTGCSAINDKQYGSVLAMANKSFEQEDFANAKLKFNEALKYKQGENIKEKLEQCDILLQSVSDFNKGNEYFDNKDYLGAYTYFKKIPNNDEKRYEAAQKKLQEAKTTYVNEKISLANNAAKNSSYNLAINYITDGLKIDSQEQQLNQLKDQYQVALNKQIDEQKKAEEERKKKEAEAKAIADAKAQQEAAQKAAEAKRQEEQKSITVYVTKTGEKYHTGSCRYLSKSKIPISLKNAKFSYSPCSVCNPPR